MRKGAFHPIELIGAFMLMAVLFVAIQNTQIQGEAPEFKYVLEGIDSAPTCPTTLTNLMRTEVIHNGRIIPISEIIVESNALPSAVEDELLASLTDQEYRVYYKFTTPYGIVSNDNINNPSVLTFPPKLSCKQYIPNQEEPTSPIEVKLEIGRIIENE